MCWHHPGHVGYISEQNRERSLPLGDPDLDDSGIGAANKQYA